MNVGMGETVHEVIQQADALCPNGYSTAQKIRWLGELEGRIHANVCLECPQKLEEVWHHWPSELMVKWPHSDLYLHWLLAKIHQANGELELYQNRMGSFNTSYGDFVRWYIRVYDPAHSTQGKGVPLWNG